jgi:hypothetical protein
MLIEKKTESEESDLSKYITPEMVELLTKVIITVILKK